jgi:hypothetical protein
MPLLFWGDGRSVGLPWDRRLYGANLREIETTVFDSYKIDGLAPASKRDSVCNIWHLPKRNHTAMAWHEDRLKHEQLVLLPGLLDQRVALETARVTFGRVIPSPIIFRFNQDYDEVLVYD